MTSRATHLSEAEFVDLLDGTLDAAGRGHVDGCEQCAAQAADLVASAEAAGDVVIPEPPPFFWAQLSARVSDAVANETAKPRSAFAFARLPWLGGAAAATAVILWMFVARHPNDRAASSAAATVQTTATAHRDVLGETDDLDADDAWALVRSLAEDLDAEQMDAEGVSLGAGAAERLAWQLTDAERSELARLLEEQLRRNAPPESAS